MKRLWGLFLLVGMIALTSAALAQVVLGPPDDPYIKDTTMILGRVAPPYTPPVTVNSVNISQLDCSRFPQICSYVEMKDSVGNPIAHFNADSFCVYQDGTRINAFTVQELHLTNCPTSICLVIDVSGSMDDQNKIGAARDAARAFVRQMDIYDRVAIVKFSSCYTVVQTFTSDTALLISKINTLSAGGNTALFDGIWEGEQLTKLELGSKAVVTLTDGMENNSQNCGDNTTPNGLSNGNNHGFTDDSTKIVGLALSAGIPIHTISLGTDFDPIYLQKLSAGSKGTYYHAPTAADIATIYNTIKNRMCSQYLVCYNSPDTVQNGDWHNVVICRQSPTHVCGPCDTASCQEVAPPVIVRTPATINLENSCQRWSTSRQICAWVTDKDTPQADLIVTLFYRNNSSSSYTSVPMSRTDSTYCYTIAAADIPCGTDSIQYYITAADGHLTVSDPPLAPINHRGFKICPNHAPVVNAGADQTIAQCNLAQICWATSATDVDGNLQSVQLIEGPGTYSNNQICFTPTGSLDYEFVLKATDSCGLSSQDTVVIHYSLNHAPVANAGRDSTLFLCQPQQVCWTAGCTDVDNNITTCHLLSGPGTYNGSTICFTPSVTGNYTFVMEAIDACGATSKDTAVIHVTLNSAPVCTVPHDTTIFQCTPTQVSLAFSGTDPDNNLQSCVKTAGPGSLVGNNWVYTPSGDEVANVTIQCTDACGATCISTFHVTFDVNQTPTISLGHDTTIFQCAAAQICLPYTVSDPDVGQNKTITLLSGPGALNQVNSTLCFTPTTAGLYTFVAKVQDACGAFSQDTLNVTVTFNSAPVASAGADQTVFQCTPSSICWPASCSDVDGNLSSCQLLSGPGTYNGSQICFTPTTSGDYQFVLKATDACGATAQDTVVIHVTENSAPHVVAQADTSLFLCTTQSVCVSYVPSDPNGLSGLTETMISGYGSIDTLNNKICFSPTTTGDYQFIVGVTDGCGLTARDTVVAHITFGQRAMITCPASPIAKFLCAADSIIQPVTITPAGATVTVSAGIYSGGAVRFKANSSGSYPIRIIASSSCGADTCNVTFNVTINSAPVASAGADQTVFQCTPSSICWPASCSDVDGNLSSCQLLSGPGTYNGSQICFTPTTSGDYQFVLKATDACGATAQDTVVIHVTENSAPHVVAQADTSLFLCTTQSVCVSYVPSDPNGLSGLTETMISGYGSIDTLNNKICFSPTTTGDYQFIVGVTDGCGLTARDTVVAHITFGQRAMITCPASPIAKFLCAADSIIQPVTITPAGATVTVSAGIYSGGAVRFKANSSGSYPIRIIASSSCGADTCNVTFNVTINSAPVASAGADQTVFQCTPSSICWPASCSDVDGNLSSCQLLSGPGTYNGSQICFTPTTSGDYQFVLKATDACGATAQDTVVIHVTENSAPHVVAQADTSLFLCTTQSVCVSYVPSDPNGLSGLTETMISGYGSIDTLNNKICFSPTTTGDYQFIVGVTDGCGLTARDTVVAQITFGQRAMITCPASPIAVSLCAPGQVCQMVPVSPSGATVTTSFGTWSGGQLCFQADTSGSYHIRVIASQPCGADTCNLVFNVDIGHAADISCPTPQTKFICAAGQVCIPLTVMTPGATFTVTPIGSYNAGEVCFPADTSGHYQIKIKATTPCGSDSCVIIADITINSKPVAVDPATPVDTFMCAPAQVCRQFSASDVNGGALTWTKLSGAGSITSGGQWCFNVTAGGSYAITAKVADSCGAADTTTLTYNVTLNTAPVVTLPADTSIFLCTGASYCVNYTVSDVNNNVTSEQLLSGAGTIDTAQNKVCFTPATSGNYQFIVKATDACGAYAQDTIVVNVTLGTSVHLTCPVDTAVFLCSSQPVCRPVSVSIPSATVTVSPQGTYSNGQVCFTPTTSGHYAFAVIASSTCGADTCHFAVDVTINSRPVAVDPATPVDTFMCATAQVCRQFSASDVNGNGLTWSKLSGAGSITSGGLWCFNVTAAGTYAITAVVTDPCGAADTTTLTYQVTLNSAPVVTLPRDTSIFICTGGNYCFTYTVADANNNVTLEQLLTTPGTIDTALNRVCFSPTSSGTYQFIVKATDACGAIGADTMAVTVTVGTSVHLTCPVDTAVFLCASTQVCRPVTVSIPSATVTVSPQGTYSNGQVCFTPTTGGHYAFTVIAASTCGADTCHFAVDVVINSRPVATDPPATVDTFMCASAQVCRQFSATDANGNSLVWTRLSGAGTVSSSGLWCFTPTASGAYAVSAMVADPCGAADTVTMTYNVTINGAPHVALGADVQLFQCIPTQYCINYTVTDPNNNVVREELVSGPGTIDTALNKVCFTPPSTGSYTFIVKATDACNAVGVDTVVVTISQNRPPVANAGRDTTIFQCAAAQVCLPISNTDPDGNLSTCTLVQGTGTLTCSQLCFTPPAAGTYTFIERATDSCGAFDDDTVVVTILRNSGPVCHVPKDTTIFQCTPTLVQLPVNGTDVDGNFDRCELVSGPGSLAGGFWTHTPSGTEVDKIVVKCLDKCGAFCQDTFTVTFHLNSKPVANAGRDTTLFFCQPGQTICWPASCSDPDGNLESCQLISSLGTYNSGTGQICFTVPSQAMNYGFIMKATDSCGREAFDTSWVRINLNHPPTITLPSNLSAFVSGPGEVCFDAHISDIDNNLQSYTVTPVGTYQPVPGRICFNADSTGTYTIHVSATDSCGAVTTDSVKVTVEIDECLHVQIQKVHNALQGHYMPVNIYLNGSGKKLGGFDLLVSYDQSVLVPNDVEPGPLFLDCKWEYFTYRFGARGNCGNGCPSGMLRIIGLAETINGAYHPSCNWSGQIGTFAYINFLVSSNYTYGCQFAPINFFWIDCADNSFSSPNGDTMWVSRRVFDFEGTNITNTGYGFPGMYGVTDSCLAGGGPGKPAPERCIDFTDGGIDIVCPDSIDARGDINLNGVKNEVADAVMFTNYFISGLSVFGSHVEGSIAASDVNGDGTALSIADLVYLIRVIIGDAKPFNKPLPGSTFAISTRQGEHQLAVGYNSPNDAGAVLLVFETDGVVGEPQIGTGAKSMDVQYKQTGNELRVLIFNIGKGSILAGNSTLLTIPVDGTITLREAEVADYLGRPMKVTTEAVPTVFELAQNYPNPFNPLTTMQFSLPVASEWSLTIYNVLGQVVDRFKGNDQPGIIKVQWDAKSYASGVYFYQLKAGSFIQAKKMILLK